jgi:hypothetical protein
VSEITDTKDKDQFDLHEFLTDKTYSSHIIANACKKHPEIDEGLLYSSALKLLEGVVEEKEKQNYRSKILAPENFCVGIAIFLAFNSIQPWSDFIGLLGYVAFSALRYKNCASKMRSQARRELSEQIRDAHSVREELDVLSKYPLYRI